MIPIRRKLLFPAGEFWVRVGATNIAGDDLRVVAQFSERPLEIGDRELAALPICHCLFEAKTIEIDRHINIPALEIRGEALKVLAPVLLEDRSATLSIFRRAIVGPGMNFEPVVPLGRTIGKNIVRPPTLEISATPDRDVLHMGKLKRAIDPTAASPFWRANVPIRMIIKRNQNDRLGQPT